MKKLVLYTLLLTLLILLVGCDNGSVSETAAPKSSGLVKVSLTVDGESSGSQKSVAVDGTYWTTSLTYQYNAVPQWRDPQGADIHGTATWTTISYFEGVSLGYFAPGQWVFGVRVLNGPTVVYEGFSDVIDVKNSSVAVDVFVKKLVTNAVAGSVRISVTAPSVLNDTLTVSYENEAGTVNSEIITATSVSDKYPFEHTFAGLVAGNYTFTFTFTHSTSSIEDTLDITIPADSIAVISGHLDNGIWQLEPHTVNIHGITIGNHQHGNVYVSGNIESAAVGDIVTLYIKADDNASFNGDLTVTCNNTHEVVNWDNIPLTLWYSFIMPDDDVTVTVNFVLKEDTKINLSYFKTILKAIYDSTPDNIFLSFVRSDAAPDGVESLGVDGVSVWYEEGQNNTGTIYWHSAVNGNTLVFRNNDTDMSNLFKDCDKYRSIDMTNINTSKITNMSHMFDGCANLRSVNLSGINTSSVQNMSYMFNHAGYNDIPMVTTKGQYVPNTAYLQITGLEDFNTSNVKDMSYMFHTCSAQTLDVSSFNPKKCTDFSYMFSGEYTGKYANFWYTKYTALDVSGWEVGSAVANNAQINMEYMFNQCQRLQSIAMTDDPNSEGDGWDFSKVINITNMFNRCEIIESIIFPKHTNLNKVSNMLSLFCHDTEIPLTGPGSFTDIFSRWDISTNNEMAFTANPIGGSGDETPNRIVQGDSLKLKQATTPFATYNDYVKIEVGGSDVGSSAVAQRVKRTIIITVTADAVEKSYNSGVPLPDPDLTYTVSPLSLPDWVSIDGELGRTPGEDPGSYDIIQNTLELNAEGINASNCTLNYIGNIFSIIGD